jgi:hypothetical protein
MSFRGRLTAFFLAIVVLPMIAVAVLVVRITEDSRDGKADATLGAGLEAGSALYEEALIGAPEDVARIAGSPAVSPALARGDERLLQRVARRELRDPDIVFVAFFDPGGTELAGAGAVDAIAASRLPIELRGQPAGEIEVAALEPTALADQLAGLTGTDVVVVSAGRQLASTTETDNPRPAVDAGGSPVDLIDSERRAAGIALAGSRRGPGSYW